MAVKDKIIITCAVTGASPKPDHPAFPCSNEEVANAALEAGEAGASIIHFYGLDASFAAMREQFDKWGALVIIAKGFTPIPYKIVTIASGAFHFDLLTFGLASLGTRGARFFLEAFLLRRFGAPIRDFIEKRLTLVTMLFLAVIVGGFVALRYI